MDNDMSKVVFFSYRRKDSSTSSLWLAESFRLAFGSDSVFIDMDSIRVGDDWAQRIDKALENASILVVVIGPSWLRLQDEYGRRRLDNKNDWVRNEIAYALSHGIKLVPVLVQNAELPQRKGLPEDIQGLCNFQTLKIRDDTWERDRESLIRTIEEAGFQRVHEDIEYPMPHVHPNKLSQLELSEALKRLPQWKVVNRRNNRAKSGEATELYRQFIFESFEDAMHFMMVATRHICQINHHPDWRNLWRSVSVWLTTWDIGHKPSSLDLALAEYLEDLYLAYKPRGS